MRGVDNSHLGAEVYCGPHSVIGVLSPQAGAYMWCCDLGTIPFMWPSQMDQEKKLLIQAAQEASDTGL